ncbi:MAG: AAA family ATPase [Rhodocyclales bacterium]|nr:AAA family ATPase [Rhodocyclales bacterium]
MDSSRPLPPEQLYRRCDPAGLGFASTAEVGEPVEIIDQARAIDAVHLGIDIKRPGFNLFVLGEPGSGRHAAVHRLLEEKAATEPVPADICYVNNFGEPNHPRLLLLPAGRGSSLKQDMQQFVSELANAITAAFESEEFRTHIEAIQKEFKTREEGALQALGQGAADNSIALMHTPAGFVFAPIKGDETMSQEEFQALPAEEQQRLTTLMERYSEELHKLLAQFPRWRREMQGRVKEVSRNTMRLAVGHMIEELKERYADLGNVLDFLNAVQDDVVESAEELRETPKAEGDMSGVVVSGSLPLFRYQVNLLVDRNGTRSAPVVFEDNPTFPNLVGRIDHIAHMGTLVTNFTMIMAGALHKANGGYLMLDVEKVLGQPFAWEELKRALKSGQIRIESIGQMYGLMSTASLEPEPLPIDLKVVLIGQRLVYYLLKQYDPEFDELFRVAADFEDDVARSEGNTRSFARFVATLAQREKLRPFSAGAVARVIEYAARLADDAGRLSSDTRRIRDLLVEADHCADQAGSAEVRAGDVDLALTAQIHRADRLRDETLRQIRDGLQLIDVSGSHVGQVNGLAVVDLGDFRFGHPVRITATARIGEGDVIDIERETELGGAIHSKGVMILASFLGSRYSRTLPLALSASLVFEQSYGPVEGDSASLAELCALMSALAVLPIKQSLAITGSVNQYGRVQAIGGVNEKIEGFFDVCQARGLSGDQGVLIPASNVRHLMLRDDVVAACAAGSFHVHAVEDVDAAMSLLTGVPAGEPSTDGEVPEGTVNYLVATQLAELTALRQAYAAAGRNDGGKHKRHK